MRGEADPNQGIYGSFAGMSGGQPAMYGTVTQQQPMYQQQYAPPPQAPAPDVRGVGISFDQVFCSVRYFLPPLSRVRPSCTPVPFSG